MSETELPVNFTNHNICLKFKFKSQIGKKLSQTEMTVVKKLSLTAMIVIY